MEAVPGDRRIRPSAARAAQRSTLKFNVQHSATDASRFLPRKQGNDG
jgi:hypothetical protein